MIGILQKLLDPAELAEVLGETVSDMLDLLDDEDMEDLCIELIRIHFRVLKRRGHGPVLLGALQRTLLDDPVLANDPHTGELLGILTSDS